MLMSGQHTASVGNITCNIVLIYIYICVYCIYPTFLSEICRSHQLPARLPGCAPFRWDPRMNTHLPMFTGNPPFFLFEMMIYRWSMWRSVRPRCGVAVVRMYTPIMLSLELKKERAVVTTRDHPTWGLILDQWTRDSLNRFKGNHNLSQRTWDCCRLVLLPMPSHRSLKSTMSKRASVELINGALPTLGSPRCFPFCCNHVTTRSLEYRLRRRDVAVGVHKTSVWLNCKNS